MGAIRSDRRVSIKDLVPEVAASVSSGAQFYRCALQVNPYHYAQTFRGHNRDGDANEYAKAIMRRASELDISVIALTDHNSVKDIAIFKAAARERDIQLFPGFELSSSEGVHVLCIYPQSTEERQLDRFLGEFEITRTEPSSDLSKKPFDEILKRVRDQGGITIAAHVTTDKGLFEVLDGQARINAWKNENLLAIQIPGSTSDLADNLQLIVKNKDPNYKRECAASKNQAVAVINAKDVTEPEDLDHCTSTCWIKMSEVTIEGLRQAFLDPDSRIRLNSDPDLEDHAEFLNLSWESGFLDGVNVAFNPNLNILIGGRGAGKSTIIESLRCVLDLEPVGDESKKNYSGIVRQVLQPGTKLSLRVRTYRPARRDYLIERTIPHPPIVYDEDGKISKLLPKNLLPPVEIYGQHELSELTRSPEKLPLLLQRFVHQDEDTINQKVSLRRDLEQVRKTMIDIDSELEYIDERLSSLPSLEETLTRYQEAGFEDKLKNRSLIVREERLLDSIPDRIGIFREWLEVLRRELPIDQTFISSTALADLPGRDILVDVNPTLEKFSNDLEQIVTMLGHAINRFDRDMDSVQNRWKEHKDEIEKEYEKLLRELRTSAADGQEFIRLRSEIEKLRPLRERQRLLTESRKECEGRRRQLLVDWEKVKTNDFHLLGRAAKRVNKQLKNIVQVKVIYEGDRKPLCEILKVEIGGRLSEVIQRLQELEDLSVPQFVAFCQKAKNGPEELKTLQEAYQIPLGQAERLSKMSAETLMKIEELDLPPEASISLNTAPIDDFPFWQDLNNLSTGQKATAVLLLLLLKSDAPLVIDQPEDDLDNRFITDGIVPRMREEKRRRQFIFSTHNANIPVLGDAELILGLTASGEADVGRAMIKPDHMGSIDNYQVRKLVEEILEGGREAFETRRRKYGF